MDDGDDLKSVFKSYNEMDQQRPPKRRMRGYSRPDVKKSLIQRLLKHKKAEHKQAIIICNRLSSQGNKKGTKNLT